MDTRTPSPSDPNLSELINIREVAELMGLTRSAAYMRYIRGGIPGVVRKGGRANALMFSRKVITEWLAGRFVDPFLASDVISALDAAAREGSRVKVQLADGRSALGKVKAKPKRGGVEGLRAWTISPEGEAPITLLAAERGGAAGIVTLAEPA